MIKNLHFNRSLTRILTTLAFAIFMLTPGWGWGQLSISAGGAAVTQNFNSLGTSPTASLPTDWTVQKTTTAQTIPNYSSTATNVEKSDGNNISTTAANGIYRFNANDLTTESAIGGLSGGATGLKSVAVYCRLKNAAATPINSFTIYYNVEKFRNGSNSAGFTVGLYYSTNGTSWTSCGSDFTTNIVADANNNGYTPAPGSTIEIPNKTFTPSTAITENTVFYFAWRYSVTSGSTNTNAQALGIDDVAITANGGSISAPTTQASSITFAGIAENGMTTSWTNGDGAKRVVIMNTSNSFTNPSDGTDPTANAVYSGSGEQVVYNNSGNSVAVTGLNASTTYWFRVYEYNGIGATTKYLTTTATGNPNSQATTTACAVNPTISTTVAANNIAVTTASSGGQTITSGTNCTIIAKGVCWNTTGTPTTSNSKTTDGTGTGDFTSTLTSLSAQTLYYARAYATNSFGTAYANEVTFRTLSLEPTAHPNTFTATAASSSQINLTFSAASTLTNADGYIILRRTGSNPTSNNIIDGVAPTSLTMPSGTTLVTDINSTLTTTYNNTGLPNANTQYNYAIIAYNWDGINPETYNYYTSGTIKTANATTLPPTMILPYTQDFEGTTSEWILETTGTNKWAIGSATNNGGSKALYISNNSGVSNAYTTTSTNNTAALLNVDLSSVTSATLTFDWKSNGEPGFDFGEVYIQYGASTTLISNLEEFSGSSTFATKSISLNPYIGQVVQLQFVWNNDGSLGDQPPFAVDNVSVVSGSFPAVTTSAITSILANSASGGGNVTNDGGSTVTARGVCWNTTGAPTISDPKTTDGSGTGVFTSSLTGLIDNTLYYVRAYATNSTGTAYGDVVSFTTSSVSAPVATAATGVSSASFNANWGAVTGANGGYLLDVSTSATFGTGTPTQLNEGFETGLSGSYVTGNLTLGSGTWYSVDAGLKVTGAGLFNSGIAASQMKANSGTLTSPALNYVGTVTFYAKASSGTSTMTIKKIVNSVTTTVATKTITNTYAQYTVDVNEYSTGVQIVFAIGSTFGYIDDIAIGYGYQPSFVTGYNAKQIVGQATISSEVNTNLTSNTTYYYRLRAVGGNSTSANSNTITVSTLTPAPTFTTFSGTGNWTTTANWDPGIPGYASEAIIDGTATITTAVEVTNLTIYATRKLIIESTGSLTVTGILTNSAGNSGLVIKSGGSLISSSVSVAATVEREIISGKWHLISPPVQNMYAGSFSNVFLQTWSEPDAEWTYITDENTPLVAAKGYSLFNDQATTTYQFTGALHSGDKSVGITHDGTSGSNIGSNLVGNPYPSYIDWNTISGYGACYVWNGSVYLAYPETGSYGTGSRYIAPVQGFFIVVNNDGEFSLINENRVHNTAPFYKNASEIPSNSLMLEATGNDYSDKLIIRYNEETTHDFEMQSDAYKFVSSTEGISQLYSYAGDKKLSIDVRPSCDVIQLGFTNTLSGEYQIGISEMNGISKATLEDTKTATFHNLLNGPYSFSYTAGDDDKRFKLRMGSVGIDNPTAETCNIYSYDKTAVIDLPAQTKGDIYIYNLAGQLVKSEESATGKVSIGLGSTGVYLVKVVTNMETLTKKVWIR